jgi:diguanylate cyclase (GGDEF)-like protein
MPTSPDESLAAALFRLLAAPRRMEAAGVFTIDQGGCRLLTATPALEALMAPPERTPWPVPANLSEGCQRLSPDALGLDARFAAAVPIAPVGTAPAGFLLLADRAPRRLTLALAERMTDAAALAAPLLARAPARPARPPVERAALAAAIRPRATAQHLLEAALRRRPAAGPVGLLMLDLDRFRAVNEALGIAAGDALLAVTGTRLERSLGPKDRLMRLEGDRFVIVSSQGPSELRALAHRLLEAVSRPLVLGGRTVVMHASIGIVAQAIAAEPAPDLLLQADTALRRAKAEGRGRFVLHEPAQDTVTLERSRLELDLAHAAAKGQMHLAYQPYVDLRDGRISGAEALLRWRHPTRGELAPLSFIPLAEATGMILPLGRWALRTALAQAMTWPAHMGLAVNISPVQFHQPGFLGEVDAALDATGFPAERLELEITETVLMRDNSETTGQLQALIARGIRIALDDFGTGYSALAYLARLPHHRIKLDKAFVQDLGTPATAELIRAIIALARAQGVAVTAEGVETPKQLAQVRRIGFTHAQGYATGIPVADPSNLRPEPVEATVC